MTYHRCVQGDVLDAICYKHYGTENVVEQVYAANPDLAELGAVLPMGTLVFLPEINTQKTIQPIRLWSKNSAN